ncbi:hypothetical protein [Mycobacteroides abscessus]|uniref:hypothetical protein n=1 Tax=Mycobacteroides abscessus TaxID=36809 RepID=UPI0019D1967F|nr:hypothetical protein [Mycobacteroides abscessus]MBN7457363.1 hypothetical protein [Mycobacteroides abscessus subsp. abscessus]
MTVTGEYLDADGPAGLITLGCGIDCCVEDLGLEEMVLPRGDEYLLMLCELVDRQLLREPKARLVCPEGTVEITLLRWG